MKYFILYIQPLKMELIEGSETSVNHNRTPGKYPKEYIKYTNVSVQNTDFLNEDQQLSVTVIQMY